MSEVSGRRPGTQMELEGGRGRGIVDPGVAHDYSRSTVVNSQLGCTIGIQGAACPLEARGDKLGRKPGPIRPQIARAHRRSSPRRPMPPLVAWLERQLMRGIWAAVDRPNPTNCRRTVAKRAPHQTASLTGYLKRAPIGPKSLPFLLF